MLTYNVLHGMIRFDSYWGQESCYKQGFIIWTFYIPSFTLKKWVKLGRPTNSEQGELCCFIPGCCDTLFFCIYYYYNTIILFICIYSHTDYYENIQRRLKELLLPAK